MVRSVEFSCPVDALVVFFNSLVIVPGVFVGPLRSFGLWYGCVCCLVEGVDQPSFHIIYREAWLSQGKMFEEFFPESGPVCFPCVPLRDELWRGQFGTVDGDGDGKVVACEAVMYIPLRTMAEMRRGVGEVEDSSVYVCWLSGVQERCLGYRVYHFGEVLTASVLSVGAEDVVVSIEVSPDENSCCSAEGEELADLQRGFLVVIDVVNLDGLVS